MVRRLILESNASSLALTWDFENKMTTADIGNNSSVDVTYKWDALGRRVYRDDGTSAFVYVQVGQQTIADYGWSVAPASPKYNYVYASYIEEPVMREEPSANERLFFHRSQQFSTVALTTSSGAIAERYVYSAYGAPTVCNTSGTDIGSSTKDNRITYTGREWDEELVLYHFRARLYDAGVGRFLGRDPLSFWGGHENAYVFLLNNVLIHLDPSGKIPIVCYCYESMTGVQLPGITVNCTGLADNCCKEACGGEYSPGNWIIAPDPDAPCGELALNCSSGVHLVNVYPNSDFAKLFLLGGSGCVTFPTGIHCTGTCDEIKIWRSGDNPRSPILDHEACHFCKLVDDGVCAYLMSAGPAPDGCVGNEIPTVPLW
jgi:RHS repeat-associated protein